MTWQCFPPLWYFHMEWLDKFVRKCFAKEYNRRVNFVRLRRDCVTGFVAHAIDCETVVEYHKCGVANFFRAANIGARFDALHSSVVCIVSSTHSSEKCHISQHCCVLCTVLDGKVVVFHQGRSCRMTRDTVWQS